MSTSITQKIHNIRAKSILVVKSARNTGLNSDYASFIDVSEALKPALAEQQLTVGFMPGATRREADAWIQQLHMQIGDGTTVETHMFEVLMPEGNRGVNLTQRQGMAHTYGRRYALIDAFGLLTGDDDDAQRMGQPVRDNVAPHVDKSVHWSTLCYVPLFDCGDEQAQGAWAITADPSDEQGVRTLGDSSDQARAKTWLRWGDECPGLNAWRAEMIQTRAVAKGVTDWADMHRRFKKLNLPETFAECDGSTLNAIALELR